MVPLAHIGLPHAVAAPVPENVQLSAEYYNRRSLFFSGDSSRLVQDNCPNGPFLPSEIGEIWQ